MNKVLIERLYAQAEIDAKTMPLYTSLSWQAAIALERLSIQLMLSKEKQHADAT